MSFKKNKYTIIRKVIDKDLALFLYNYFIMKRQVYDSFLSERYFSHFDTACCKYE